MRTNTKTTQHGRWAARRTALVALVLAAMIGLIPGAVSAAPVARVDLRAGIAGPERVAQGQTAVYSFQGLTESTPRPENVRIVLKLPAGVTYESAEPGAVSCGAPECPRNTGECTADSAQTLVTCTADNVVDIADGHYSFTATVRIAADVAPGAKLTVVVEAVSDGAESTPADNTSAFTSTVIIGADLGVTVIPPAAPVVPGKPVTFSVVVHNYGPATVAHVTVFESFSGPWFTGGKMTTTDTGCFADPGSLVCEAEVDLAAGEEVKLDTALPTAADDDFWGLVETASVRLSDLPDESGFDTANNRATFPIEFAKRPAGNDGSGDAEGGGLPVTGARPLALAGLLLLLGGTAAVALARRRRPQA